MSDKAEDGIWIVDAEGRTAYVNERMCEILRVPMSALLGRNSFDFIFPEDAREARRLFEKKMQGDTNPFHFKLRSNDGSPVWVEVQGTPMFNAAGEFKGIVGTFTQTTPLEGSPDKPAKVVI